MLLTKVVCWCVAVCLVFLTATNANSGKYLNESFETTCWDNNVFENLLYLRFVLKGQHFLGMNLLTRYKSRSIFSKALSGRWRVFLGTCRHRLVLLLGIKLLPQLSLNIKIYFKIKFA